MKVPSMLDAKYAPGVDPRAEILKHADAAAESPQFFNMYAKNDPDRVLGELEEEDDDKVKAALKAGQKRMQDAPGGRTSNF
jgi:hypothetical protein